MEINVILNLQDHNEESHKKKPMKLKKETTIEEIGKKIKLIWGLDENFQELYFNRNQILDLDLTIERMGLQNNDQIVVKHVLLDTFSNYLFFCKCVKDMKKTKAERTKFAHRAVENSKTLENSKFFDVYSKFAEDWTETIGQMMRFVDRTQNAFKQSATTFFSKMFPDFKIDFRPKQDGTRAGIIVTLSRNDEEINYYMKTYHHAGSSFPLQNTSKRYKPDIREMFAYRLLEHIGVGPAVFFPFYAGSTYIHYIATKQVNEFKELDKVEDVNVQNKIVVEAYLLSLILGIRDLNEGNIGIDKEKNLAIVDFYVADLENFLRPEILDDFLYKNKFGGIGKANEILTEIGSDERMEIAKNALPNWIPINSMTSDIIDLEKKELRENGIKFGTATNDINIYLQHIKSNYVSILSALE